MRPVIIVLAVALSACGPAVTPENLRATQPTKPPGDVGPTRGLIDAPDVARNGHLLGPCQVWVKIIDGGRVVASSNCHVGVN